MDIFKSFGEIAEQLNKVMPLDAIWVGAKRITAGDKIEIQPEVHKSETPTHEVKECKGTINNHILQFVVINLETKEESTIDIF